MTEEQFKAEMEDKIKEFQRQASILAEENKTTIDHARATLLIYRIMGLEIKTDELIKCLKTL